MCASICARNSHAEEKVAGAHELRGAGFSLWELVHGSTKPHRLKPAPPNPEFICYFKMAANSDERMHSWQRHPKLDTPPLGT